MGIWNTYLYANDMTSDIRDTYIECLQKNFSNEESYKTTYDEYIELIGTDEEALLWFALADTQWELGRLMPLVKKNALKYIDQSTESFFDEFDKNERVRWKGTLDKLAIKLNSTPPPEIMVPNLTDFKRNPWNYGDIYVYKFHSKKAKEFELFGKYIAIQKIGNAVSYENMTFSVIQIYNKVFSSLPNVSDIIGAKVLPLVFPPNVKGTPKNICDYIPSFEWFTKAIMLFEKPSCYPAKHLTFIGNSPLNYKEYSGNGCVDLYWETTRMEDWLIDYYIEWQNQDY